MSRICLLYTSNPQYVSKEEVPADVIEKEKEILRAQALNEGKPEKIVDRMVEGRIEKYYKEVCLLEQPFVKDSDKTVKGMIMEAIASIGENISVRRFVRYEMGEGLSLIHILDVYKRQPFTRLNGPRENRLPNNASFCFEFVEGEGLLLMLDMKGIAGASGSACTSGSLDPSHVLLALGLPHEIAHGSLRLTLGTDTTQQEIDTVLEVLPPIVERLRMMSPLFNQRKDGLRHV